jgi:putative Holliday junction resolvase
MKYLGIDFGLATVGLSLADGPLAEPLGEKKYHQLDHLLQYLANLCRQQQVQTIVIGLSENTMAQKTQDFGRQLAQITGLPVVYQDETLTTKQAQQKLIEAQAPMKKRQRHHRIAATIILQAHLDSQLEA